MTHTFEVIFTEQVRLGGWQLNGTKGGRIPLKTLNDGLSAIIK